jgi:threonine dehydrogenase-like Zn-dependent dehydrogenase
VVEATGDPQAIETACYAAREDGRVIVLGSSRGLSRLDLWQTAQSRRLEIIGAHVGAMPRAEGSPGRWTYRQEGQLFMRLMERRGLTLRDLITDRVAPQEANAVYERLVHGDSGMIGVLFEWGNTSR